MADLIGKLVGKYTIHWVFGSGRFFVFCFHQWIKKNQDLQNMFAEMQEGRHGKRQKCILDFELGLDKWLLEDEIYLDFSMLFSPLEVGVCDEIPNEYNWAFSFPSLWRLKGVQAWILELAVARWHVSLHVRCGPIMKCYFPLHFPN